MAKDIMESEEEGLEMYLLPQNDPSIYRPILESLRSRQLYVFKSLIRKNLFRKPANIDLDFAFPHPDLKTLLDEACCANLPEFVDFLLEAGADPNRINEDFARAPIHFCAESGSPDALKVLIQDPNIQPNLVASGLTALHFAVQKDDLECAKILLQYKSSPNIPNSKGLTALHFAASKGHKAMVNLILESCGDNVDLDNFRDFKKQTTRQVIVTKFPDLRLPEKSASPDDFHILKYHLDANDENSFLTKLQEIQYDNISNATELLKLAIEHNLKKATVELINKGALKSSNNLGLAKLAIERGHYQILSHLLNCDPTMNSTALLLPACQELGVPCKPGPNGRNSRLECLKLILGRGGIEVDVEDDKGNTPLHYAARAESREAIEFLLKKGSYIGHMNNFGIPPLARIPPDILQKHFDDCLSSAKELSEDYEIIIDYRNLQPHSTVHCAFFNGKGHDHPYQSVTEGSLSEAEALFYIAKDKSLRYLLKHPLLSSFLNLKWHRIRHILYANFFFYLVFFILINSFILSKAFQSNNSTMPSDNKLDVKRSETGENNVTFLAVTWLFLGILALRELLQFIASPCHYLNSLENWVELLMVGLAGAVLLGAGSQFEAVVILLSTWELIILLSQHPKRAVDIEMFKTVSINFMKCLCLYALMIIAFALSFFVLFRTSDIFPTPGQSLFKTLVMFTGEFEANDIPFADHPVFSHLVFVAFVFLIAIVLLNLLNGLAVNDTAEILAEAELVCLISRTKLLAYIERIAVGAKYFPKYQMCCCLNYCQSMRMSNCRNIGYLTKRVLLFPQYLPHGKLSIKPHKNNQIVLHGRTLSNGLCTTIQMDSVITKRAKEILRSKNRESVDDKLSDEFLFLRRKLDRLEYLLTQKNKMKSVDDTKLESLES